MKVAHRTTRASSAVAIALAFAGAIAIGSASADPPPKVYKACPRDKVWSETANGCVCAEGRAWDDKTKTCALEGGAKEAPAPTVKEPSREAPSRETPKEPAREAKDPPPRCPQGKTRNDAGACVDVAKRPFDAGTLADGGCGPGREWKDAFGGCVPACGRNEVLDFYGRACHPIRVR